MIINLTQDQIIKLSPLLSIWRIVLDPSDYVNLLMTRWEMIVQDIEKGYRLTIYDYENDLYTRTRLKYISDLIASLNVDFERNLKRLDMLFINVTVPAKKSFRIGEDELWWYSRIPKIRDKELEMDFRKAEFL